MKLILALIAFSFLFAEPDAFVAQMFTGGRFGEQLQGYLQAKWVSFTNGVPLFYTPFSYSSFLVLDEKEIHWAPSFASRHTSWRMGVSHPLPDKSRYCCYYYCREAGDPTFFIEVDWKNEEFRKIALEMIAPKERLSLVHPPDHTVNIAIHVREGGGFDKIEDLEAKIALAMKIPPLQFYVDSLLKVLDLFPDSPLYCHLFTDAAHPEKIAEELQKVLPKSVLLNYRRENNRHDANVLEDFFSLFHFDVLIRSQSQFSLIPSYLHDFAVVCSPGHFIVQGNDVAIDKIDLVLNEPFYRQCFQ